MRRPIEVTSATTYQSPRDKIWSEIRSLKTFTLIDLEKATNIKRGSIETYVKGLHAAGYLKLAEPFNRFTRKSRVEQGLAVGDTYELVKDVGVTAPRVTKHGKPVTQGLGRARLWQSIRILRKGFSVEDLVMTANTEQISVSTAEARTYCQKLRQANYLKKLSKNPVRYSLLPSKNTGPRAPMIQRNKAIFDPNKNAVVWTREGGAQ